MEVTGFVGWWLVATGPKELESCPTNPRVVR